MKPSNAITALRRKGYRPVHRAFVDRARRRPFDLAFTDVTGRRVSYAKALGGAVVLAR